MSWAITDFVVAQGQAYYLMEYLKGETLAALLRREGPLPPARAVGIARQVAAALEAAHRAGFVHLDIKPSNIYLVETCEGADSVKLLDFGTAQLMETAPRPEGPRPSGMFHLGTPVYMSPEQASGDVVDHRSDLYSLGAVLYEMIAGRPPFQAQSGPEYIYKHMTVAPQRLTQIRGLAYRIPRACNKAVMQCLEKDPANRPATAARLMELFDKGVTITEFEVTPDLRPSVSSGGGSPRRLAGMIAAGAAVDHAPRGRGQSVRGVPTSGRPGRDELGARGRQGRQREGLAPGAAAAQDLTAPRAREADRTGARSVGDHAAAVPRRAFRAAVDAPDHAPGIRPANSESDPRSGSHGAVGAGAAGASAGGASADDCGDARARPARPRASSSACGATEPHGGFGAHGGPVRMREGLVTR